MTEARRKTGKTDDADQAAEESRGFFGQAALPPQAHGQQFRHQSRRGGRQHQHGQRMQRTAQAAMRHARGRHHQQVARSPDAGADHGHDARQQAAPGRPRRGACRVRQFPLQRPQPLQILRQFRMQLFPERTGQNRGRALAQTRLQLRAARRRHLLGRLRRFHGQQARQLDLRVERAAGAVELAALRCHVRGIFRARRRLAQLGEPRLHAGERGRERIGHLVGLGAGRQRVGAHLRQGRVIEVGVAIERLLDARDLLAQAVEALVGRGGIVDGLRPGGRC